jgi:hypothetical protein
MNQLTIDNQWEDHAVKETGVFDRICMFCCDRLREC